MTEINVAQLLKSPIGTTRRHEVDDPLVIGEAECKVKGELTLMRTNRGILITGQVKTDMELTCSRCLELFGCPLTMDIEEEYFPTMDVNTGASLPPPEDPGAFTIDHNNTLDVGEAIRQYALLAVPMKPLCRENCAGLCATCGANLNAGACHCPPNVVDPRLAGLEKLRHPDAKR